MTHPFIAALVALTLADAPQPADDSLPAVFDARPFAAARQAARESGRWFFAEARATWCTSSRRMNSTTWRDESVVNWLKANAVVVAFDVDQNAQLDSALSIETIPTLIAFREDKEFDRLVGYQSAEELLAWFQGLARGEKARSVAASRPAARAPETAPAPLQSPQPSAPPPRLGRITRGDIKVPIVASGLIQPNQAIEVKPEASGVVLAVPVAEGMFVTKGDRLVEINPEDEIRLRDRAKADFDRAEAMLAQARIAIDRAVVSIEKAKAQLEAVKAEGEILAFDWQKIQSCNQDADRAAYSAQEKNDAGARYRVNVAQKNVADIAVRDAELAKLDAEAAVRSQEATVLAARKTWEDEEARVRKTTVSAPQDGIVTQVYVKPGMVVQSAMSTYIGGTPLLVLADVSTKKVIARLNEADYGRVLNLSPIESLPDLPGLHQAAQQDAALLPQRSGVVHLTADAFPNMKFEGCITRLEPQGRLNPPASVVQFNVHIGITDPKGYLLPLGAQAQVEFAVASAATGVLRVPAESVKMEREQKGVWLKAAPNSPPGQTTATRFVPCRFGLSDGKQTQVIEVLAGEQLKENDEVYIRLPQGEGLSPD